MGLGLVDVLVVLVLEVGIEVGGFEDGLLDLDLDKKLPRPSPPSICTNKEQRTNMKSMPTFISLCPPKQTKNC